MLLRTILLTVGLLSTALAYAQKPVVEIGPEIKIDKDMYFWGHLHSDKNAHYVMLMEGGGSGMFGSSRSLKPIVQKYDRKYSLVYSKELKVDDDDIAFGNMLYARGKFFLCTQTLDKKAKKLTCSVTPINLAGQIAKVQRVASVQYTEKDDKPTSVVWQMSEDTSKLLVATMADDNDDDLKMKISVNVLDNELNKQWGKGFVMPYTQEQLTVRKWSLDNEGHVYMLGKVYDGSRKKESKKSKPAYRMIIFRFDQGADKPKEYVLGIEGKFVTDITFKLNHENDLSCAGFYSNDRKGTIQGVFFTRLDGATGASEMASQKELTSKDMANLDTEKDKSGNEGLESEYTFNNLILRDDGGIVVTAEEAYVVWHTTGTGANSRTYPVYHNNEIFITSVAPDGKIEWVKVIPKKQIFSNTRTFNGYDVMVSGSNMYFLYNDDEDNIKRPLTDKAKRISSFKDAVAALVTVSSEGKMTRRQIFDSKEDADALMVPDNGEQISPNELFFVTTRFKLLGKTRLRLGLVRV